MFGSLGDSGWDWMDILGWGRIGWQNMGVDFSEGGGVQYVYNRFV